MGLFSGTKRTYVSSQAWNLAGDIDLRPQILREVVLSHALDDAVNKSLGERLTSTYLNGSGVRQRNFFRWADQNYFAMPTSTVGGAGQADRATVAAQITAELSLASGDRVEVSSAVIDQADIDYWAEDYVRVNHPTLTASDWSAFYDTATDEVVVSLPGPTEERFAADADLLWGTVSPDRKLLFASYTIVSEEDDLFVGESDPTFYVYRIGSGNAVLDGLVQADSTSLTEFYPAIPIRLNGQMVNPSLNATQYDAAKQAYRRYTGGSIDKLIANLNDNANIGDVDHAFMVPGVALNTKEKAAQDYIFRFFQQIRQYEVPTDLDFGATGTATSTGTLPAASEVRVYAPALSQHDMRLQWLYMTEELITGNAAHHSGDLGATPLSPGQFKFESGPDVSFFETYTVVIRNSEGDELDTRTREVRYSRTYLMKQESETTYRLLEVFGLEHQNYVYNGQAVIITASQALADTEESGFIVPMHFPTVREMGMVNMTQMATASSYLVLNSYEVVKQKWYQTDFFRFIIVIAAIALSVVTGGGSLAAGAGILGTNAAVGAALGASAATAAIVGAVANAAAGMVLARIISAGATAIFGDEVGAIVAAVVTFAVLTIGPSLAGGAEFDWSSLMTSESIMSMTDAVSGAYRGIVEADILERQEELVTLQENYQERLTEIEELRETVLGNGAVYADVLLEDILDRTFFTAFESPQTFLDRTLLNGSDIVALTQAAVSDYVSMSLDLSNNLV